VSLLVEFHHDNEMQCDASQTAIQEYREIVESVAKMEVYYVGLETVDEPHQLKHTSP